MSLEVTGTIYEIFDEQQITSTFSKREFVLELVDESPTGMTFTNYASFQLVNRSCPLIDPFQKGEKVKVSFNLRGNKWEKDGVVRYITNLNAWRIERAQEMSQPASPENTNFSNVQPPSSQGTATGNSNTDMPEDDLPF